MKYRIASAGNVAALEKAVAKLLEAGWKPQGSMVLDTTPQVNPPEARYYQPMVK